MTGLETALFGAAAVNTTVITAAGATTIAGATVLPATAGLIGFGGVPFAAGATLGGLGTAFTVGSGIFTVASSISQGGTQAALARNQAFERRQLATQKRQIAAVNADSRKRSNEQTFKSRTALLGGSNIKVNTGTPLLVSGDIAARFKEEEEKVRFQGEQDALAEESRARIHLAKAGSLERAGKIRATSALLSTGKDLFA